MRNIWEIIQENLKPSPGEQAFMNRLQKEVDLNFCGADGVQVLNDTGSAKKILEKNIFRNQLCITADPANASDLYIGMTMQTGLLRYFSCLQPGDDLLIDNFKGELFALPVNAGDKLAIGEW
jgi:hypothetical protein